MSENIIMPKLGMTMKEGTVEEWFKNEDTSNKESVCTINSEKLTQDVEAPASGTLLQIKVQAGEETEVKSVLGIIGDEGESTESSSTTDSDNERINNSQLDDEEQQTNDTTSVNEDDIIMMKIQICLIMLNPKMVNVSLYHHLHKIEDKTLISLEFKVQAVIIV